MADSSGNLYFTDDTSIYMLTASHAHVYEVYSNGSPQQLAVTSDDSIYFTDLNDGIYHYLPKNGNNLLFVQGAQLSGLVIDSQYVNMYVSRLSNGLIYRVPISNPSSHTIYAGQGWFFNDRVKFVETFLCLFS